ncbi:MAG: hypothetical protein K940chlam9_01855 [Chlamydiae bacterium]|nr:hypothetical protein [Chlamydiota bacterium]
MLCPSCKASCGSCPSVYREVELPFVGVGILGGLILGYLAVGGIGAGALGGALGGLSSASIQAMIATVRDPISLYIQHPSFKLPPPSTEEIEQILASDSTLQEWKAALHSEIDLLPIAKKGACFGASMTLFQAFEEIRSLSWEEMSTFFQQRRNEILKYQLHEILLVELTKQGVYKEDFLLSGLRMQKILPHGILSLEMERGMVSIRRNSSEGHMVFFQNEDSFYRIYDSEKGGSTFPNKECLLKHLNQLLLEGTEPTLYA